MNMNVRYSGPCNVVDLKVGEPYDINPSGYDNCERLHEFVKYVHDYFNKND